MTRQKVAPRLSTVHPRDLIFAGLIVASALIFFGKALEFSIQGYVRILALTMAMIGIAAVGQTVVIITGGIDLSVGSLIAFTTVIIALLTNEGESLLGPAAPWAAVLIGLALAGLIGWIHGLLISRFRLAPFVVTFGSMSILRGLSQVASNGSPINLRTNVFGGLWSILFESLPVAVFLMLTIYIAAAYLLRNSRFGRYIYAVGSNETVARLSGIDVGSTRQLAYAISGLLAGLVGLLYLAWIEGGTYSNAEGYELLTIAAVIIGGTSLKGGTGGVWGTLGGILLLSMVRNGLVLYNVPPRWNDVITGSVIVGAALVDIQRRRVQDSVPVPAAARASVSPPPPNTLDQALANLTQAIEERCGCSLIRVYLLDRETGNLVESVSQDAPSGTLISQASQAGKPVFIDDVRHDRHYEVDPLAPEIRAAAAVPILYRQRLIGVLEVQSEVVGAFADPALESMAALASQMAGPIEDTWLLEGGWLNRQLRECLRNLSDEVVLNKSALGEWLLPTAAPGSRGEMLHYLMIEAIERLRPESADPLSRSVRRYQILKQTYINQKAVDAIINDLGLSRRQYFYDLKEGIDAVMHHLVSESRLKNRAV